MDTVESPSGPLSIAYDGPTRAASLVVLGHGAGAGIDSDFMVAMAAGLAERDVRTCRFNFPYVEQGRKAPDRQPVLEDAFRAVAASVSASESRLVLGGKSLGGRIASHVVAGGFECDGLAFLGYPLHPPGRPDRVRKDHLKEISVPMLFVEGTRDPFCPLDTLDAVRRELAAPTEVAVIDDGDHSLKVRKSSGRTTPAAWTEVVDAVAEWVGRL